MTYIIQQNAQNYKRKSSVRKIPDWGSGWCRNIRYNHTGRSARTPSCLGTSSACPLSGRPGSRAHRRRAYRSTRHSRGPQRTRCSCKWPTSGLRWPMPDLPCLAGSGPVRPECRKDSDSKKRSGNICSSPQVDECHEQRAYTEDEIKSCLKETSLRLVKSWTEDEVRTYFVIQR